MNWLITIHRGDDAITRRVETQSAFVPVLGLRQALDALPVEDGKPYKVTIEAMP